MSVRPAFRCFVPSVTLLFILVVSAVPAQPPGALNITRTLEGHKELVYSVAFTPDGQRLASGAFDKTVKLWDLATGKEVKTYAGTSGHQDLVLTVAVSPDGRFVASGGKDNSIKLWDNPGTGPTRDFTGSPVPPSACTVTTDGTKLITGGDDGAVRVWTTSDGKVTATLSGPTQAVTDLAVSASGKTLVASAADGTLWFWNLSDHKLLGTLGAHAGRATAVAFHPNGELVYSVGQDGLLKGWSLPTPWKSIDLPNKPTITAVARTEDGSRWAVAGGDKIVRIIKVEAAAQDRALPPAPGEVVSVAIAGNTVVAGLSDGRVVLWDIAASALINQHELVKNKRVVAVSLRADGNEFAAALEDGSVRVGEVSKDKSKPLDKVIVKTLPASAVTIQYHPTDGNMLATGGADKALKIWRIKDGTPVKSFTVDGPVTAMQWNKDGKRIAVGITSGVQVLQAGDGKVLGRITLPGRVKAAAWSGDEKRLVTTAGDDKVRLLDVATGKELERDHLTKGVAAAFHPDQKRLVLVTAGGVELAPIALAKHFVAHAGPIRALELLDGGNRAVTGGEDGVAKIINLANGSVDKELKGHSGPVLAAAVTPNGQLVFTGGADKTVRVFHATDGKELKVLPHPEAVQSLAVQGPADLLVAGCAGKSVVVSTIPYTPGRPLGENFGKVLQSFSQNGPVTAVAAPATVATLYSTSADKTAKAWRVAGDGPVRNLAGHGNLVDVVAYSPDGLALASCSHDGTIRFWNPSDGKQTGEIKLPAQPLYCLAWRPDGKQLAVGAFDHSIRIVDVSAKKVEREIKGLEHSAPHGHNEAVYSIVYTPDGLQLYSAGADGMIKLWKVADGGFVKDFVDPSLREKSQRDFINQIRLTPDGGKLLAAGNGGWMTVWNTSDGKLIHSQKFPTGLYGLAVSPDGKSVATGNQNGTVYVIKMP